MKKIIGILGVAVIAATMFFTTDVVNSTGKDITLGSLITMNTANAVDSTTILSDPAGEPSDSSTNVPKWANYAEIGKVRTVTKYFKASASGTIYAVSVGTEGSYTVVTQETYQCCKYGGANCPQSLIFC
jgi:hypothetical protein